MILIIIASLVLIINVLMQEDKTGGLSASIGGGVENSWSKNKGRSYEAISDKVVIASAVIIAVAVVASIAIG